MIKRIDHQTLWWSVLYFRDRSIYYLATVIDENSKMSKAEGSLAKASLEWLRAIGRIDIKVTQLEYHIQYMINMLCAHYQLRF